MIEAITEDLGLKLAMWKEVDGIVKPEALLRDQHLLAAGHRPGGVAPSRPERFLGLHFFNPVQVMKLLEVIRA